MGRRWASKPRRARARRRAMATSSEQAPAGELHDGGAHRVARICLQVVIDKQCVFHSLSAACKLSAQDVDVFSTKTSCYSLAEHIQIRAGRIVRPSGVPATLPLRL